MKKLLIASLIASTSLMAVADETTLYGAVGYIATVGKNTEDTFRYKDGRGNANSSKSKTRANLDTDELWWGVKGEENISDNLNAFWKLEFGNNGGTRHAYVGLKGDSWGTLTLGTQNSLFKILTNYNDIFQADGFWNSTTRYDEGFNRPSNVISYVSPNWSGFQFGIAGILNGKDNVVKDNGNGYGDGSSNVVKSKNKSFGAGQVGLWYNANGFYASLAYEYVDGNFAHVKDYGKPYGVNTDAFGNPTVGGKGGTELIGGSVGYKNDNFKVGFTEQHKASDGDKMTLAGEYYFGPNTIRAGVSYAKSEALNNAAYDEYYDPTARKQPTQHQIDKNKVYTYAVGYQYNLSKRTYTFVEANFTDWNKVANKNGYEAKVGLRHDF